MISGGGAATADATIGTATPGGAIAADALAGGSAKGSPTSTGSSSFSAVARRDVMGTTLLRTALGEVGEPAGGFTPRAPIVPLAPLAPVEGRGDIGDIEE